MRGSFVGQLFKKRITDLNRRVEFGGIAGCAIEVPSAIRFLEVMSRAFCLC
jgi:hypothetical protein